MLNNEVVGDKDERGKALSANLERGAVGFKILINYVFFCKLVDKWDVGEKRQQLTSQLLDVDLMVRNDGWQTHHHHQLSLL